MVLLTLFSSSFSRDTNVSKVKRSRKSVAADQTCLSKLLAYVTTVKWNLKKIMRKTIRKKNTKTSILKQKKEQGWLKMEKIETDWK